MVERIEGSKGKDGKIISDSIKKNGQMEVRHRLEADAVRILDEIMAHKVTLKDVIELTLLELPTCIVTPSAYCGISSREFPISLTKRATLLAKH